MKQQIAEANWHLWPKLRKNWACKRAIAIGQNLNLQRKTFSQTAVTMAVTKTARKPARTAGTISRSPRFYWKLSGRKCQIPVPSIPENVEKAKSDGIAARSKGDRQTHSSSRTSQYASLRRIQPHSRTPPRIKSKIDDIRRRTHGIAVENRKLYNTAGGALLKKLLMLLMRTSRQFLRNFPKVTAISS